MGKYLVMKMGQKTVKNKAVLIHRTTSVMVKFTTVIKHYGIIISNYTGGTINTPNVLNCVPTAYSSVSNKNFVFNSNLDVASCLNVCFPVFQNRGGGAVG